MRLAPRSAPLLAALIVFALAAAGCRDGADIAGPGRAAVSSVTLVPDAPAVIVGEAVAVRATPRDAQGLPLADRAVEWSVADAAVATVSAAGVVTGVAPGVAQVTATSEGRQGTVTLTVSAIPVTQVEMTPPQLTLIPGGTQALGALGRSATGAALEGRPVTWASGNAAVAEVSAAGVVTAKVAGTANVTATIGGVVGTTVVTVLPAPVATVLLHADSLLETGSTQLLSPTVLDAAGYELLGRQVSYSWSDARIVTISASGLLTAHAVGEATIAATVEGKSATLRVRVTAPPAADLLYQRSVPDTSELFVLSLAHGDVVRINAGSVSRNASASPDGSRIAFAVSMRTPLGEVVEDIYAVDRTGTNMRRLTTAAGVDDAPAWSPATRPGLIAFQRQDAATGRSDIWLMNADGTEQRNLTADMPAAHDRREPAWSPDGDWIAFVSNAPETVTGRSGIWLMRADGSAKRRLTVHPGTGFDQHPTWSPDGEQIAFGRGGINLVEVATGMVTALPFAGTSIMPSWSPDGRHIAYAWRPSNPGSGQWAIHTMRPDGTDRRVRVPSDGATSAVAPGWIVR